MKFGNQLNVVRILFVRFLCDYYGKLFLTFTLFNVVVCILFLNINTFLVREIILLLVIVFMYNYSEEVKIINNESRFIEERLVEAYPFMKYYGFSGFLFLLPFWISATVSVQDLGESLLLSIYLYWLLFGLYTFIKVWVIFSLRDLHHFFNVAHGIKTHGFCSFMTVKQIIHGSSVIGKFLVAILIGDLAGERVLQGDVLARSKIERKLGLLLYGIDAKRSPDMKMALWYIERHPDSFTDKMIFDDNKLLTPKGLEIISRDS